MIDHSVNLVRKFVARFPEQVGDAHRRVCELTVFYAVKKGEDDREEPVASFSLSEKGLEEFLVWKEGYEKPSPPKTPIQEMVDMVDHLLEMSRDNKIPGFQKGDWPKRGENLVKKFLIPLFVGRSLEMTGGVCTEAGGLWYGGTLEPKEQSKQGQFLDRYNELMKELGVPPE